MRANELRLRGCAAWVATSLSELHWLLEHASIGATYAIVDLQHGPKHEPALTAIAPLAAAARLPVVLIGASIEDAAHFPRVQAIIPAEAEVDDIMTVLSTLPG